MQRKHTLPRLSGRAALLAMALLPVMAMAASEANLSIDFIQPEKYTDAGYSRSFPSEQDRAEVRHDVEKHLRRLAERGLPADASLKIEVLDIDLAGRFEPWQRATPDLRVMRDVTWPRIKLRYTLTRGDQAVATKVEEQVSDMNYMASANRYPSGDSLRYEKAMLDEWFEKRVVGR